ncbi:TetR/AcrR family transcriptional regulator [Lentilactobacillus sunkii]|uniref:HTH tetR-type domain-containing protein n=1 Tax=Lentilactobacillus sunkii DSM 19904 TaxID=1423808 RepID=A0A0R1L3I6_9LACO|nr:TetR/AcrR family transcriptional regulator [Lentilactobacillus sunkii]KRK87636.1 hypothetical protein FD17_GL000850 [Lentilactobacillus sunkii DSM 19904]
MFQNITMKQSIYHAFIEVMETKIDTKQPEIRISNGREMLKLVNVTEITKAAHINRRTFYTYFHDIYDLFDQLEDNYVSGMNQYFQGWEDAPDPMESIVHSVGEVIDYMSENRRGIKLVSTIDTVVFPSMIQVNVKKAISATGALFNQSSLGKDATQDQEWDLNYTIIFLASGFGWASYEWLLNPDVFPKEKLKELISSTFVGAYKLMQSDELINSEHLQAIFNRQQVESNWR